MLGSRWGKIAGVPIGIPGGAYFAFWILAVGAWWRSGDSAFRPLFTWAMTIGAALSLTLLFLLLFFLEGTCLFCLLTHLGNLGAVVLLWPWRRWRIENGKPVLVRGVSIALIALLLGGGLFRLYETRVDRATAEAREKTIW